MFLIFLNGEQRLMKRSGDLDAEQATKIILAEQPGHGIEVFRSPLWNKKSLTCSSVSMTMDLVGGWCSGTHSGLPCRMSGVRFPYQPILEKCAKGICLCNLLRSTQPNDRETVIEG